MRSYSCVRTLIAASALRKERFHFNFNIGFVYLHISLVASFQFPFAYTLTLHTYPSFGSFRGISPVICIPSFVFPFIYLVVSICRSCFFFSSFLERFFLYFPCHSLFLRLQPQTSYFRLCSSDLGGGLHSAKRDRKGARKKLPFTSLPSIFVCVAM